MKNIIFKAGIFLILLLPILNYPPLFSPPDFSKSIVFRIIFSVLLALFAYYCFFHKETNLYEKTVSIVKKGSLLFYTPLVLLGVFIISTIFSLDPHFSIFGDPNRGGGLLTFGMIILFSYMLIFVLQKRDWKQVWNVSFVTGALVCFFALAQWSNIFENLATSTRPFSTMGNPTLLSIYVLLLFFPLLAFFIKEKQKLLKWIYFALLLLFAFVILITFTRAVFIGLFLGMLYFFLFYPRKAPLFRIAAVIVLLFSIFSVYYVNTYENPRIIEENSTLNRLTSRLSVERAFNDPRIGGFVIGWEAIKDRPVLGYGPENFNIAFNKHYHPEMPNIEEDIPWWDKAHNLLIEMTIWGGIPAGALLLLFFALLFLSLQKNKNREKHTLQAGLIAFFAASMFTIDSFSIFLVFFFIFAYIFSLSMKEEPENVDLGKRKRFTRYGTPFIIASVIFLFVFIYSYNTLPLSANRDMNQAVAYKRAEVCEKALELADRATKYDTIIDSYLYVKKSDIYGSCLETNRETVSVVYEIVNKAEEERPLQVQRSINKVSYILQVLPYMNEEEKRILIEDAQSVL